MPARMAEAVGQLAVVRKQDQSFRKIIQPAHGKKSAPLPCGRHEIKHGTPSFRIAGSGDHAHRLVQHEPARGPVRLSRLSDRCALSAQTYRAAVHLHQIGSSYPQAGTVRRHSVYRHAPREDQLVGLAPGTQSCVGQSLVQTHPSGFSRIFAHISASARQCRAPPKCPGDAGSTSPALFQYHMTLNTAHSVSVTLPKAWFRPAGFTPEARAVRRR